MTLNKNFKEQTLFKDGADLSIVHGESQRKRVDNTGKSYRSGMKTWKKVKSQKY